MNTLIRMIVSTRIAICALVMLTGGALQAQDAARIKPKPPSEFASTLGGRNPFWLIGWKPVETSRQVTEAPRPVVTSIPPEVVTITGILLGSPPIAVINGGEFVPGDDVPLSVNGENIKAKLISIGDGFVRLRYEGRDYIIRRDAR